MSKTDTYECDVLVIGTGASGLATAVTAGKAGLKVLIVEKEDCFGGTTATSGGVLWVPGNHHSAAISAKTGVPDDIDKARAYILDEAGNYGDRSRIEAYLTYSREMVEFMERETEVKFYGMDYPDYHSENPNSSIVRSIGTLDYQASMLGKNVRNLKNQLPQTMFFGFAFGSSVEMKQFMRAGRSIGALGYVVKKLAAHFRDVIKYGRSEQIVRGRALIARLMRTAFDLNIPLWLSSPARRLIVENGHVLGAEIDKPGGMVRVMAKRAVVLACGGYPGDAARRKAIYPRLADDANHRTPTPQSNTGDGIKLAEQAGGVFNGAASNAAAWMPISVMPGVAGFPGVWPHLVDRQKPGFIAVLKNGKRFTDESASYHDFVPDLVQACANETEAVCYLIADKQAVDHWGIGFVRPFPIPRGHHIRSGYLLKGETLAELAAKAGIDGAALETTVREFNKNAVLGKDPEFGRGGRTYDIYQGDDEHAPNPCLGPLEKPPFYAVKIVPGEIATFTGLKTDATARVIDANGSPVPGLYAVGNDQASVWGGAYPGAGSTLGPGMTFGYIAGRHIAGLIAS
jgi:hypothetical protein